LDSKGGDWTDGNVTAAQIFLAHLVTAAFAVPPL